MAKDLVWNRRMLKAFEQEAILTEDETDVLHDWANHRSIANTSVMRHMSERKVNYVRKSIRNKYDRVQVYTPELPPRK
jgi:hypothetical protein